MPTTSIHGRMFGIDSATGTPLQGGSRVVTVTSSTVTITREEHANRLIVLDLAGGIAVTLPDATGTGDEYEFFIKTTFTGASTIKSSRSADVMVGHAVMGNDSDNATVRFPAVAGSTLDTVDMLGTSNSTGGLAGQWMRFVDAGANLWAVEINGDAAGTEATPFANTVG